MKALFALSLVAAAACSDALERDTTAGQVVAVAGAVGQELSLVSAENFAVRAVHLPMSPAPGDRLTGRGNALLLSFGGVNTLLVIDLAQGDTVTRRIDPDRWPASAGFESDSIAWVPLRDVAQVARVNYQTGAFTRVAVGGTPTVAVVAGPRVFVVTSDNGGTGWVAVRSTGPAPLLPGEIDSIPLTGTNPQFATLGADGLLYVVMSGTSGGRDGRLSIVDPVAHAEVAVINGLGESPQSAVYHPSGRLLIASVADGILEVNTLTRRGPGPGLRPDGVGVAALAVDSRGRVYAAGSTPCAAPGVVHVLAAPPDYHELRAVTVASCPLAAAPAFDPKP